MNVLWHDGLGSWLFVSTVVSASNAGWHDCMIGAERRRMREITGCLG